MITNVVVVRKWYSTAEVAEMLGYGTTKTKFLVLSGQVRMSHGRRMLYVLADRARWQAALTETRRRAREPTCSLSATGRAA